MKKTDSNRSTTTTVVEVDVMPESVEQLLTTEEARVLRMRIGARVEADRALGSKLDDLSDEQRDEVSQRLALIETSIRSRMANAARAQRMAEERAAEERASAQAGGEDEAKDAEVSA